MRTIGRKAMAANNDLNGAKRGKDAGMQWGPNSENLTTVEGEERKKAMALIVEKAVGVISEKPLGTEMSVTEALQEAYAWSFVRIGGEPMDKVGEDLYLDTWDMLDLTEAARRKAKESGLKLDSSKWEGMDIGLPWNVPFAVK